MSQLSDLFALLGLASVAGTWLTSSRARERAVEEARQQCGARGLQLLDETVGLNAVRLRRVGGRRQLEWGYAFEVSAHGDDRMDGRLWMRGARLAAISLPSEPTPAMSESVGQPPTPHCNVIPMRAHQPRTRH